MPPTRGAFWMWKVDGGFPCYVVLVRDAFEFKVEERPVHAFRPTCLCKHLIDLSIDGRALPPSRAPRM